MGSWPIQHLYYLQRWFQPSLWNSQIGSFQGYVWTYWQRTTNNFCLFPKCLSRRFWINTNYPCLPNTLWVNYCTPKDLLKLPSGGVRNTSSKGMTGGLWKTTVNGLPFQFILPNGGLMVVYPGTKQQTTSNNLKQIQVLCLCITSFYLFSQPFTTQDCRRLPPLLVTTLRETRRRRRLKFNRGKWFCREAPQTPWQKYWVRKRRGKLPVLKENWQLGNKFSSVSVKRLPCKNKQQRIWCQLWSGWSHDVLLKGRSVKDT